MRRKDIAQPQLVHWNYLRDPEDAKKSTTAMTNGRSQCTIVYHYTHVSLTLRGWGGTLHVQARDRLSEGFVSLRKGTDILWPFLFMAYLVVSICPSRPWRWYSECDFTRVALMSRAFGVATSCLIRGLACELQCPSSEVLVHSAHSDSYSVIHDHLLHLCCF